MKIRSVKISNVRSFLEEQTLLIEGEIAIIVGPNGGGKTNLLDTLIIAIKRYIMPPAYARHLPQPNDQYYHDITRNDQLNMTPLDKHSGSDGELQSITIEFEISDQDIANMAAIKAGAKTLIKGERFTVYGSPSETADGWDLTTINSGDRISLQIVDGAVVVSTDPQQLLYS